MKTKTLFFTLLLLPLLSVGQQRWEVVLGNPVENDYPYGISNCIDNGNIIYSYTYEYYYTLYKVNVKGEIIWTKNFKPQPLTSINASAVYENIKGEKVLVGFLGYNGWIMLLNACGDKLWCRKYDNLINNFWSVDFMDALMLDNIILVSAFTQDNDYNWGVYLLGFDYDGNLLWDKPIATHQQDPLLAEPAPIYLKKVDNDIFIVGDCYYAYPDNPNVFHWRSMFIKLDSLYNKEWFLPYGMADHIGGSGFGVLKLDSTEFRGYGRCRENDTMHSIFMNFDKWGNETRHKIIPIEEISPNVRDDDLRALHIIDDTSYYITSKIGINHYDNPLGEFVVDTSGNSVYYYQNHPEITQGNLHPTVKTYDNRFITVATVQNTNTDILLYKLKADLTQAEIDTNTYVYDSLCPHAIVSDTIYLNDCDIVTALPEFPTPEAWQQAKQTVELTAYPNPVSGNTVNFKLKYTKYHDNMQLVVYDISGRLLATLPVASGAKTATLNIAGFSPGMHVAVVRDNKKVLGKAVFNIIE
jgi:hypothetical protein